LSALRETDGAELLKFGGTGPPKTPSTIGVNIKNSQHKNLTQLLTKAVNQGH
jgi:hypothetical protein